MPTRKTADAPEPPRQTGADLTGVLVMLGLSAGLYLPTFQWTAYRELLAADLSLSSLEIVGLGVFLLATTHVALLPILLVFWALLRFGRRRLAHYVLLLGTTAVFFLLTLDLLLQQMIGSHLSYFLPYAFDAVRRPTAGFSQWGGDLEQALVEASAMMCVFAVGAVACFAFGRWVGSRFPKRRALWIAGGLFAAPVLLGWPALATVGQPAVLLSVADLTPVDSLPLIRRAETLRRAFVRTTPQVQILSAVLSPRVESNEGRVVLLNTGPDPVDLNGWKLEISEHTLPLEGRIDSLQELPVILPGALTESPDQAGTLRLLDQSDRWVDRVEYRTTGPGMELQFPVRRAFDTVRDAIDRGAKEAYGNAFAAVVEIDEVESLAPERLAAIEHRPHVLIMLAESFRHEMLAPDRLPKLDRWADGGLRLDRHFSGSNSSHWGIFSLLYSRSPLLFDSTLDAGVPPQLTHTFKELGYETSFICAADWRGFRGMDRYLREPFFDSLELVGRLNEDWTRTYDGDLAVLDAIRKRLAEAERPQLIVGFLVSTHFPYYFPDDLAVHQPTGGEVQFSHWTRIPHDVLYNRYRNTGLFVERELLRLFSELDPAEHLIVVTGDHGESMFEDGTLAHGTRPSEIQMRVPFAMVGAGTPAQRISQATWHGDVLPTLLHAMAGSPVPFQHADGRDLLAGPPADRVAVAPLKWWSPRDLLLIREDERWLFQIYLDRPDIRLVGRIDAQGRFEMSRAGRESDPQAVVRDLTAELERLAR